MITSEALEGEGEEADEGLKKRTPEGHGVGYQLCNLIAICAEERRALIGVSSTNPGRSAEM